MYEILRNPFTLYLATLKYMDIFRSKYFWSFFEKHFFLWSENCIFLLLPLGCDVKTVKQNTFWEHRILYWLRQKKSYRPLKMLDFFSWIWEDKCEMCETLTNFLQSVRTTVRFTSINARLFREGILSTFLRSIWATDKPNNNSWILISRTFTWMSISYF